MAVSTRMRRTRAALGTLAAATLTAVAVTTTFLRDNELLVWVADKYLDVNDPSCQLSSYTISYRGIVTSTKRNVIKLSYEDRGHCYKESRPVHIDCGANWEDKFRNSFVNL